MITQDALQRKSNRFSCQLHGREAIQKEPSGGADSKTLADRSTEVVQSAKPEVAIHNMQNKGWLKRPPPQCPHQTPHRAQAQTQTKTAQKQTPSKRAKNQVFMPKVANLTSLGTLLVTLLTLLARTLPLCSAQSIVCSQENWYYGFDADSNYEFQAMDSTPDGSRVVFGGQNGSNGAQIIALDMDTGTTLDNFELRQDHIDSYDPVIRGVLDVKMHLDGTQATAVMQVGNYAISQGKIAIVQFTLGDSATVRVAYMTIAALANYSSESMLLVRGHQNQVEFLFSENSTTRAKHWYYHIDFATDSYFLQMLLDEGTYISYIQNGDAVIKPNGQLLMATKWYDENHAYFRLTKTENDQTAASSNVVYVGGNDSGPGKLVAESDDTAYLVTKDVTSGGVRLFTLDTSDGNAEILFTQKEHLQFAGVSDTVIQSVSLADGEVEIILSNSTGDHIILNKTRLIRVTVDRTAIGGQPWVFASHALISTMARKNGCQYGLGLTHIERLCTSEIATGSTCNSYFVTTSTASVTLSVLSQGDSIYTPYPPTVPDSSPLEAVTLKAVNPDILDISEPSSTQIINPCGIELIPFENDSVKVFKDFSSQLLLDFTSQVPTLAQHECPDPTVDIAFTSDTFKLEIVEMIKPDGNSLVPVTSMVNFDTTLQTIEFTQSHVDWVAGLWQMVYKGGFCADIANEDCKDNLYTMDFEVIVCSNTGQIMPTLSPSSFDFAQGPDTGIISLSGAYQGDCPYALTLSTDAPIGIFTLQQATFQMQPFPAETRVQSETTSPLISVTPVDSSWVNEYDTLLPYYMVTVTMVNTEPSPLTTVVHVTVLAPPCTPNLAPPSDYEDTVTYDPYSPGTAQNFISAFLGGDNGDCEFDYSIISVSPTSSAAYAVNQPLFEVASATNLNLYSLTDSGSIDVTPTVDMIGTNFELQMLINGESASSPFLIKIEVLAPECVPDLTLAKLADVELDADLTSPSFVHLSGADGNCQYSYEIAEEHGGHTPALIELHQPTLFIQPEIPTIAHTNTPGILKISPSFDRIGRHEVTVTILSSQTPPTTVSVTFTVVIMVPACVPNLVAPATISVTITVGDEEKVVDLAEFSNKNCIFELALTSLDHYSLLDVFTLDQPSFTQVNHLAPDIFTVAQSGKLRISTMTKDQVGIYSLIIHATYEIESIQQLVTIEVERQSDCDPDLQLPADLSDQVVQMTTKEISLSLEGTSSGSCRFTYELLTDEHQMVDSTLLQVQQPTFQGEGDDKIVHDPGSIIVTPNLASHIGKHSIVLLVEGQDGTTGQVHFELVVQPCEAIETSKDGCTVDVLYVIGSGIKTQGIETANDECPNSSFSFFFEDDSLQFVTVNSETLELTIETENLDDSGEYSITVVERDNSNQNTLVTVQKIYVDTEEAIAELVLKLAAMRNGISENLTSDDPDEDYPIFSPEFFKTKFGYVPSGNTPAPLTAQIYDITKAGNLTIVFSKPIILPPIELLQEPKRHLQDAGDTSQSYRDYALQQVLTIYLESAFYDDDQKEIKVLNYTLTRLTPTALDVQILFNEPQSITQSKVEPDVIKVDFKMGDLFIDKDDFQTFEKQSQHLEFPIVPQYSQERLEELEAIEAVVEGTMTTFSIGNLVLNSFLAFGLKYLWNMVTLLQFMIFMREWLVLLPDEADIFLRELRSLALLEFLQKYEIKETVLGWFGVEEESSPKKDQSLLDKLAVILLAGIVIVFLVLLLLCLRVCVKKSPRAKRCNDSIKAKLFYNTFIRYVLLGTLKIQLTFGGTVFIGYVFPETLTLVAPETGPFVFGILVLIVMSLMPFLFAWVLYTNRSALQENQIISKIGAMYFSLCPDRPYIGSYSVVFLVRRSFFVLAYFTLYYYPSMQVEIMLYSTLLYVCYISNMSFYESHSHRRIEMMNECILVGVCYHFVIFANPNFNITIRYKLGLSMIAFVSALLGVNGTVIFWVSIAAIKRKLKLKKMKKQAKERQAELLAKKLAITDKSHQKPVEAVVKQNKNNEDKSIKNMISQAEVENRNIPIVIKSKLPQRLNEDDQEEAGKLESFEDPTPIAVVTVSADLEQPLIIAAKSKGKKKKSLKMANISTKLALKRPKLTSTIFTTGKLKAITPTLHQSSAKDVGLVGLAQLDMRYKMKSINIDDAPLEQHQIDLPSRQHLNAPISKRKVGGGPTAIAGRNTKQAKGKRVKSVATAGKKQTAGQQFTMKQLPQDPTLLPNRSTQKPKSMLQLENDRLMEDLITTMEKRTNELKNQR